MVLYVWPTRSLHSALCTGVKVHYQLLAFASSGALFLFQMMTLLFNNAKGGAVWSTMVYAITSRRVLQLEESTPMLPWPLHKMFLRRVVTEHCFTALVQEWANAKNGESCPRWPHAVPSRNATALLANEARHLT